MSSIIAWDPDHSAAFLALALSVACFVKAGLLMRAQPAPARARRVV